jgi:hypothetical protein
VLRADGSECFGVSVKDAPADAERLGLVAVRNLAAPLPERVLARRD